MNDIETKCRRTWRSMMNRCYQSEASLLANRNPSYRNCKVCDKWHEYENFREWYMKNYINGYTLDKDLFKNGTPIYSPSTCCFLPPPINILLITKQRKNSNLPTGVSLDKSGQFQCIVKTNGRPMRIGTFSRISEAYEAYVKYKNNYIHCTAKEYFQRGEINERIYKALSTYEIPREEFVDEFHPKPI